jgi:hypothetical protein
MNFLYHAPTWEYAVHCLGLPRSNKKILEIRHALYSLNFTKGSTAVRNSE